MKIVVSISVGDALQLIGGHDVPDLVYVETTESEHGERIIVQDHFHHFYRFDRARVPSEPVHPGSQVTLHPVERVEHVTYTYRDEA